MAYDLVGDIHGQGDKLEGLLDHLGYRLRDGAYRHPSRTAIFSRSRGWRSTARWPRTSTSADST